VKVEKQRLDLLLVTKGLVESREKARHLILAGEVLVAGYHQIRSKQIKPGQLFPLDAQVSLKTPVKYVSRGGLKLEKAFTIFPVEIQGKVAIDVGASTGGFTDCLLQHGVDFVYAVDVGYGQIAWRLRQNTDQVKVIERTNIRHIDPSLIDRPPDLAVIDVSFISLTKVLPAVINLLSPSAQIIGLIKPQFEAGKERVLKGGVIRDATVHVEVIKRIQAEVNQLGWSLAGLTYSPLQGPAGNTEFLSLLACSRSNHSRYEYESMVKQQIQSVVQQAHQYFSNRVFTHQADSVN